MPAESSDYERFVRDITETVLHAQGLETIGVKHDVQLAGLSRTHQIDVYWEYRVGGVTQRVILDCKHYKRRVKVLALEAMGGVLRDLPGVTGVVVTTVGFEKGAIEYATVHGIGLKVIREPRDDDWTGRIREIRSIVQIQRPVLVECSFQLDLDWVRRNLEVDPATLVGSRVDAAGQVIVHDLTTGKRRDINEVWNDAMREHSTPGLRDYEATLQWEHARLERGTEAPLKLDALTLRWRIDGGEQIEVTTRSAAHAIVRDAIAGTLLFVDPAGQVTGDVEQEFDRQRE